MTRKYNEKSYGEEEGYDNTGALIFCIFLCVLIISVFCFLAGYAHGSEQVRSAAEKAGVGEFYMGGGRSVQFRWKTVTPEKVSTP